MQHPRCKICGHTHAFGRPHVLSDAPAYSILDAVVEKKHEPKASVTEAVGSQDSKTRKGSSVTPKPSPEEVLAKIRANRNARQKRWRDKKKALPHVRP